MDSPLRKLQQRAAADADSRDSAPREDRARWQRPRLVDHGDVRELTLGLTSGPSESGPGGITRRT